MSKHEEYIINSILSSNLYIGNKQVFNFREIASVEYSIENLRKLVAILSNGEYDKLTTLTPPKDLLGEELYIVSFNNEENKLFYGVYYDSIELYQDPEIIEILPAI